MLRRASQHPSAGLRPAHRLGVVGERWVTWDLQDPFLFNRPGDHVVSMALIEAVLIDATRETGPGCRLRWSSWALAIPLPRGEIATETTRSGDRTISERSYTYDARGLLVERVDSVVDDGGEQRTNTRYQYDERQRLIGLSVHDGDERIGQTSFPCRRVGTTLAATRSSRT